MAKWPFSGSMEVEVTCPGNLEKTPQPHHYNPIILIVKDCCLISFLLVGIKISIEPFCPLGPPTFTFPPYISQILPILLVTLSWPPAAIQMIRRQVCSLAPVESPYFYPSLNLEEIWYLGKGSPTYRPWPGTGLWPIGNWAPGMWEHISLLLPFPPGHQPGKVGKLWSRLFHFYTVHRKLNLCIYCIFLK